MSFFKVVLLINKTQTKEFLNHEKTGDDTDKDTVSDGKYQT